ncbi:MAG: prepilin-type N-terminal cleavage/methylation domain-containing protein [Syntrophaceae bacterium]|nr:prepilin-type N-terminal cleavage/methylation domain-containing protein [Syntrophaceae bacterium]
MPQRIGRQCGFTLIELIIVVVLLGIIGAMGAGFISEAFRGFFAADVRMEMYEEGKFALVRMEREIHIALPNAVDVSTTTLNGDTISFGVVDENAMAGVFGQYTEEHPSGDATITDRTGPLPINSLVSIYNTGWDVFIDGSNVYSVANVNANQMTMSETIGQASPYGRFYVVQPQAVRFIIENGVLNRRTTTATAVGITVADFNDNALANPHPLARNVIPSNGLPFFTYAPGTSTRNSVVIIHFAIQRPETGETVNFHKEVQIRNVP